MASNSDQGLIVDFKEYWIDYGGWTELAKSGYFRTSVAILAITFPAWTEKGWWTDVLTTIPALIGVSLAAFALFLGAGSESFREQLARTHPSDHGLPSPFLKVSVTFVHFIVVEVFAVLLAVICSAINKIPVVVGFEIPNLIASYLLWGLSYLLFIYSFLVVLAAAFGIYEVVKWFGAFSDIKAKK